MRARTRDKNNKIVFLDHDIIVVFKRVKKRRE